MARVLLVTTNFWPEPTGIAIYTTDLAVGLSSKGYEVSVLTSLPHYPWWKVPEEYSQIAEGIETAFGIETIRIKHFIPTKMNALLRIRFEMSLWWNLRKNSKKFVGKNFDVVISCIPAVAAGIVGKSIAKKLQIFFGVIIQDLSGAGAKQSGIHGGALISTFAQAIEDIALRAASGLVVVSPAMRDALIEIGISESRITHILNYSARNIVSMDKEQARSRFNWAEDQFIVVHTGNMGAKQDLENVVRAANILKVSSKIKIYLVGHGNQEFLLKSLCRDMKNIFIMPAVPEDDYSALLSAADLLLVNERITQMDMSLPSKLTSYLLSGRPVLASVPPNGATCKFLDGIAELVEADNPLALAQKIEELSKNPKRLKELSDLGYKFAKENLDAEKGRQKYLDWVNALLKLKSS